MTTTPITDTDTWAAIDEATRQYDEYQRIQQINDLTSVLTSEAHFRPSAPRTDQPLSIRSGH